MAENQEMLEKAGELLTTSMTNGGTLNNKQQSKFLEYLRAYGNLLGRVRFIRMTQQSQEIDKIHLGEPVTVGASEASSLASGIAYSSGAPDFPYKVVPKFNKIRLTVTKVKSAWALTPESLQTNIAGNSLESTVMNMITERMSHDLEEVAINGDTSTEVGGTIAGFADAPLYRLRKIMNGWDVLTNDAIILDVNGSYISKDIWNDMIRITPKEHKADTGRVWICSDNVAQDWVQILQERVGSIGDTALRGEGIAPMGIPMIRSSILRDDKPLTTTGAIAKVISGHFGPYNITATVNKITVNTDGAGAITITLPTGTWDANQMVALMTPANGFGDTSSTTSRSVWIGNTENKSTFSGTMAATYRVGEMGDGRIVVYSVGASPTIAFSAPADQNATTVLGFAEVGTTDYLQGTDFSAGTNPEGSVIMLTNPRNLIFGVLDGTRIFTEYDKDADVIESVIYNQIACAVEDSRAVVKAVNVRAQNGWAV